MYLSELILIHHLVIKIILFIEFKSKFLYNVVFVLSD